MSTLKVRCPECDAFIRRQVDDVDEETNIRLTCPKCNHRFTTTVEPNEDDRPSNRKQDTRSKRGKDEKGKSNTKFVAAGVVGAVLLIGGIAVAVVGFGGSKDKEKDVAKVDPAPKADTKQKPVRTNPNPTPNPNPNPHPPVTNPMPVEPVVPTPPDKPIADPLPPVEPMPTPTGPVDDVFTRAATFKPVGPLPELPPLPPVDRRPVLTLEAGGHTAFVTSVFFTPDGSRVVTVGEDKMIRLWDLAAGEPLATLALPAGPDAEGMPQAAAMSPDGKRLAIGVFPLGRGKLGLPIYILSTETGELEMVLKGAHDVPHALDFSPDGKQLMIGCVDGFVQVIEIEGGKLVYDLKGHPGKIRQIRSNPKQPLVATVGQENEVKVWSLADKTQPTTTIKLTTQGPNTLDWSADGKILAVGCTSGEVYVYEANGKPIKTVPPIMERGGPMQIVRMKFLPGDKQLIYGGIAYSGWVGVIDIEAGKHTITVKEHTNTVRCVAHSPDGSLAATSGGESNETIVWNTSDGTVVRKFAAASRGLWAVGWGKDGKSIAWGSVNGAGRDGLAALDTSIRLEDLTTGEKPQPTGYQRHIRDDGTYSIKVDNFFSFTVSENGKPLYQHTAAPKGNRIYSVTLVPGKGILVGASFSMYLIDTKTGQPIRRFLGDNGLTTAAAPSPDGRYVVTGSSDQVVRVWSPEQSEPLMSIFGVGREWIVWTPQGYYACSPYGERLIGWLLNNGIDKLPSVHPAVRFRPSLYQPELLKYLIPAGNLQLALAMTAKFENHAITATGLADVLPPSVVVTAPAAAGNAPISLKAVATGSVKNPITAMRLLVDGRPYEGAAGVKRFAPAQQNAETTWQVVLSPGPHILAVQAESAVSKGMSNPVAITRAGKAELPNLFVLAVGVSEYPGDMKLNYAATDAALLTETLKEKSKSVFNKIEVRVVTDKNATRKGILEGLDWLKSKMTAKDVGIFSFSGHGARNPGSEKFYLVPVDVNDDFDKSCVAGDEFKSRLENMPGRLVAILDACHSGAAATPGKPQKGKPTAARADNLVRDLLTDDYGVVVMCSSLGREYSMESPATKAGFFTLGLAEGLSGKADFNKDGVVYIHELDVYATRRVAQLSGGRQNPTTGRPPTIRPFPIAKP